LELELKLKLKLKLNNGKAYAKSLEEGMLYI
jgi:hypothetical protein